jgi:hypothetical protein
VVTQEPSQQDPIPGVPKAAAMPDKPPDHSVAHIQSIAVMKAPMKRPIKERNPNCVQKQGIILNGNALKEPNQMSPV